MKSLTLLLALTLSRLQLHSAKESAILVEKKVKESKFQESPDFNDFETNPVEDYYLDLEAAYGQYANGDLRLVQEEGSSHKEHPASGRLELYIDALLGAGKTGSEDDAIGTWGTVCGVGFTLREARVACRQLGFAAAHRIEIGTNQANSSVPIFLEGVKCRKKGAVGHLMRCRPSSPTFINCSHDFDVTLHCNSTRTWSRPYSGQVRLVGANASSPVSSGRVEVYQADVWGTVCRQDFSQAAADSVCRQLGYTHAAAITDALPGAGLVWVDTITCDHSAPCFKACYKPHRWSHECNHTQDVAVQCSYDVSQAMESKAGNAGKCKIRVFPASMLVLVVMLVLSSVAAVGCAGVIIFVTLRCCYRRSKKYSSRLYDALE